MVNPSGPAKRKRNVKCNSCDSDKENGATRPPKVAKTQTKSTNPAAAKKSESMGLSNDAKKL